MNTFLNILRFLYTIVIIIAILFWLTTSIVTLHYVKQNNVLLKELCVENGINIDSALNTVQNDTLNLKIDVKGE
jgi:hypothetical protein